METVVLYIPKAFAEAELSRLHELIEQVLLATVVSHGALGLQASHLPLLLVREEGAKSADLPWR